MAGSRSASTWRIALCRGACFALIKLRLVLPCLSSWPLAESQHLVPPVTVLMASPHLCSVATVLMASPHLCSVATIACQPALPGISVLVMFIISVVGGGAPRLGCQHPCNRLSVQEYRLGPFDDLKPLTPSQAQSPRGAYWAAALLAVTPS
jgi:hypothetical protein